MKLVEKKTGLKRTIYPQEAAPQEFPGDRQFNLFAARPVIKPVIEEQYAITAVDGIHRSTTYEWRPQ